MSSSEIDVTVGKTWKTVGSGDIAFVIEGTQVRGGAIEFWIARNGDGPSCLLTPTDARAVAAELIARADYIEPSGPMADDCCNPGDCWFPECPKGSSKRKKPGCIQ